MDLGSVLALASGFGALGAGVWNSVHSRKSKSELLAGQNVASDRGDVDFSLSRGTIVIKQREVDEIFEELRRRHKRAVPAEPTLFEEGKEMEAAGEELEKSEHRQAE